jgi:hypothetical protein
VAAVADPSNAKRKPWDSLFAKPVSAGNSSIILFLREDADSSSLIPGRLSSEQIAILVGTLLFRGAELVSRRLCDSFIATYAVTGNIFKPVDKRYTGGASCWLRRATFTFAPLGLDIRRTPSRGEIQAIADLLGIVASEITQRRSDSSGGERHEE